MEHRYVPLSRIAPVLPLDGGDCRGRALCSHYGVDFTEISNAIEDAEGLDDLRGGSTITQQLAKNLLLWPGRSFVRKALEFPLALWIDLVLSKRRILEIYLNIAEMGPNGEFGADAGSRRAFGRPSRGSEPLPRPLSWPPRRPIRVNRDAKKPGPGSGAVLRGFMRAARAQLRRTRPIAAIEGTRITGRFLP